MSRLDDAIARSETDWQRLLLQEWRRQHPTPSRIKAGHLGLVDVVPTPCTCGRCKSPAMIIPNDEIVPARGFVLCPNCCQSDAGADHG